MYSQSTDVLHSIIITQEHLHEELAIINNQGRHFFEQRIFKSHMTVETGGEKLTFALGCGVLIGDKIAPKMFNNAFRITVDNWVGKLQNKNGQDMLFTTLSGTSEEIDTSFTKYADDFQKNT